VRESGLVPAGSSGLALCSGGADSAGLLAGLVGAVGADRVAAIHLNYRLREDSGEDERACADLCRALGVDLVVERPPMSGDGNTQAEARRLRYDAAERLRAERDLDWIAAGHTRTDLAETVIYRLVSSPGLRALLGLPPRRGSLVRPLIGMGRAEVRRLVQEAGLPHRDDPTNAEPAYARNRIRNEVLPVLEQIAPAVERTIAETQAELREDAELLERLAQEAADESSGPAPAGLGEPSTLAAEALRPLDPALRRLVIAELAERAAGGPVRVGRETAAEVWRLAQSPEGGVVELGGGVEARLEHGHLILFAEGEESPAEASLAVPGVCRFGSWQVRAELAVPPPNPLGLDVAILDPDRLESALMVRPWREGDSIRPVGLGGTKSLQDVFTDRKVPRSLRRTLPVVTSGGRVAWVAGVAVSEEFAASPGAGRAAVLTAAHAS
jgi:tRNA(Ile)-lysidine synthase